MIAPAGMTAAKWRETQRVWDYVTAKKGSYSFLLNRIIIQELDALEINKMVCISVPECSIDLGTEYTFSKKSCNHESVSLLTFHNFVSHFFFAFMFFNLNKGTPSAEEYF